MSGQHTGILYTPTDTCWLSVPAGKVIVMASRGRAIKILRAPPGAYQVDTPRGADELFPIIMIVMSEPLALALAGTRHAASSLFEVFSEAGRLKRDRRKLH